MQEERKNGNGNYGPGGGDDNGDPQFTTPGAGQQLDETEAEAGGPIPGPMEGQGGAPRTKEPAEQPSRPAKARTARKKSAAKKKSAAPARSKGASKRRQTASRGRATGKKAKGKSRTASAGRGRSAARGSPKGKGRKGGAGRKKSRR